MPKEMEVSAGCCGIEAVVSVDARGQLVLPKELREKAGIRPGDKLAVVTMSDGEEVCCLSLVPANRLGGMVREFLGPVMKNIAGE